MTDDALETYWSLWLRVDALCDSGRGDGEEADRLRDEGDRPWREMSPADRTEFYRRVAEHEAAKLKAMSRTA